MAPSMRQRSSVLPVAIAASAVALLAPKFLGFAVGAARPNGLSARDHSRVAVRDGGAFSAEAAVSAKESLMSLLDDSMLAQEVLKAEGKPAKGRVDEAILALERYNPSEEPVYALELDGTWEVKYSGSIAPGLLASPTRELALFLYGGGFSLGNALSSFVNGAFGQNLGLKISGKTVRIQGGRDVDATAEIEVAGQEQKLSYTAELMPLSARRMSEEVVSLELPEPLGKQDVPLELRRTILVTYLDDEVMIVRDESGSPEVLVRQVEPVAATPEPEPVSVNETAAADNATATEANATGNATAA